MNVEMEYQAGLLLPVLFSVFGTTRSPFVLLEGAFVLGALYAITAVNMLLKFNWGVCDISLR